MGCNLSKSEDIQKSQEPRTRDIPHNPGFTSRPISSSLLLSEEDLTNKMVGSYTEARELENENYFKKIVDKAAYKFIDVGGSISTTLEAADVAERSRDYNMHIVNIKIPPSWLNQLPTPSKHIRSATEMLVTPTLTQGDIDLVIKCSEAFSQAVKNGLRITECGQIVVPFPSIDFGQL